MSEPNPMTREELLEAATLDAFGLLDEYEASLFTRSFHHAQPAVQREIIERQADVVSDEMLLPSGEPDPQLRTRVLGAVSHAIDREAADLEPLATIGRQRGGITEPEIIGRVRSSAMFWRAAAFALCAGLIIIAYFLSEAARTNNLITKLALMNATDQQLQQLIGPTVTDFLRDPSAQRIVLAPPQGAGAWANLWLREDGQSAFLVFEGLPRTEDADYVIRVRDGSGAVTELQRFASNGRISGAKIALSGAASRLVNLSAAQLSELRWEILDVAKGTVVLASV